MCSSATTTRTVPAARTQAQPLGVFSLRKCKTCFRTRKLDSGEWGYSSKKLTGSKLGTLLSEGYSVDPYPVPFSANWVSGVFFWEWADTAVPYNSSSGSVREEVNTDMQSQP